MIFLIVDDTVKVVTRTDRVLIVQIDRPLRPIKGTTDRNINPNMKRNYELYAIKIV